MFDPLQLPVVVGTIAANVVETVVGLPLVVGVLVALVGLKLSLVVVNAHEKYVVTDGDAVDAVLDPGVQFTSPLSVGNERVDVRTQNLSLPVEDVRTRDDVDVTVVVDADVEVTDAAAAVSETERYRVAVENDVADYQVATSERVAEVVTDHVERTELAALTETDLAAATRSDLEPALEAFGVALVEYDIESIEPTDDAASSG